MKYKFLFFALTLFSAEAFSQSKNDISVVYGAVANLVDIHNVIGDFGYTNQSGYQYGLSYTRELNRSFSLETGFLFSQNKIQLTTIGPRGGIYNQNLDMLTVPLYARYTFLKYAFVQWGFMFDHETNYSPDHDVDDQSGIGLEAGVGGKYNFGPVSIFVNPFFCRHAITARMNLMEAGARFGLGYSF
jgi:hypothetical protein